MISKGFIVVISILFIFLVLYAVYKPVWKVLSGGELSWDDVITCLNKHREKYLKRDGEWWKTYKEFIWISGVQFENGNVDCIKLCFSIQNYNYLRPLKEVTSFVFGPKPKEETLKRFKDALEHYDKMLLEVSNWHRTYRTIVDLMHLNYEPEVEEINAYVSKLWNDAMSDFQKAVNFQKVGRVQ